jgi:hypothetical protein
MAKYWTWVKVIDIDKHSSYHYDEVNNVGIWSHSTGHWSESF